ncbi:hypothetical protein Micbo1qcDRAFT_51118 [Microdochium bolleyi]|uniref:Uncharacterized protein n=1 Tax=Microdochium bolleyi TaxID=196109 RepID=A0A136J6P6_9PEZI|nr:hypothetical protein Micbo1qcDRAFT_51118 [Microdochium bolleyi]
MGAAFGDAVSSLLATYGKCLKLLKAFKGHPDPQAHADHASLVSQSQTSLRQSIRSDRSRIRNAYSARLYREGSRLSKGDSVSRSKLRRIIGNLKAALVGILGLAKTQQPVIDYESLAALSNASRIDAIRTMEDLSQRLHKPSSTSLKSTRSKKSTSSSTSSTSKSKGKKRSSDERPGVERRQAYPKRASAFRRDTPNDHAHSSSSRRSSPKPHKPPRTSAHRAVDKKPGKLAKPKADFEETIVHQRVSYISMSSDSTKLGEIPYRGSRLFKHNSTYEENSTEQRATYPLYMREPLQQEKVGLFRKLFR